MLRDFVLRYSCGLVLRAPHVVYAVPQTILLYGWVNACSVFHCVASPFHSFVTTFYYMDGFGVTEVFCDS